MAAPGTAEAFGPSQLEHVRSARTFVAEPRLELGQIPRIILHNAAYYILRLPESTEYPSPRNLRNLWTPSVSFVVTFRRYPSVFIRVHPRFHLFPVSPW